MTTQVAFGTTTPNVDLTSGAPNPLVTLVNNDTDGNPFCGRYYGANVNTGMDIYRFGGVEAAPTGTLNTMLGLSLGFRGHDGTSITGSQGAIIATATADWSPTSRPCQYTIETTAPGESQRLRQFRVDPYGAIHTWKLTGYDGINTLAAGVNQGDPTLYVGAISGFNTIEAFHVLGYGWNTAAAAVWVGKNTVTNRSINAAGTVNASGSDYAEYERKDPACQPIAPGQVVGFTKAGLLTDRWRDAISFGVKSTSPSFVGGDNWRGLARGAFDRIAYCGKVPCNVATARAGDYIVAARGPKGTIIGKPLWRKPFRAARLLGRVRNVLPSDQCMLHVA